MDLSALMSLIPAQYAVYVAAVGGVAAAVATVLPKPAANTGVYATVYKVVNMIGLNFGHAANK